jgi:hypothetical protein
MAEIATPTPTATPTPPTPAADPGRPVGDPFQRAKARALETVTADPKAPAAAAPPPAAAKAEINVDPEALKQITALSKQKRELEKKLKELEPAAAGAGDLAKAKKLYAEGKKLEAITLLSGASDPTAEMEALIASYLADGKEITAADLAKQIAEDKRLAAEEKKRLDDEAAKKSASDQEAATEREAMGFLDNVLGQATERYPLCADAKHRAEASKAAFAVMNTIREVRKIDPAALTPEAARALVEEAFEEVEVEYMLEDQREATRAALRDRVSKGTLQTSAGGSSSSAGQRGNPADSARRDQPETRPATPTTIDRSLSRPGITTQPQRRYYSHEDAKQRAFDRVKHGAG